MNQSLKLDKEKERALTTIQSLSHDGRGVAIVGNKTTFISGALPGETITYKITQKRSTYNEAEALEIVSGSAQRVTPACHHFGLCGGCSLQHMSEDAQLQLKQNTLLEQLKHFGQVVPEFILPPLTASTTGYRRKARLGVKYVIKKNKLLIGFREKSSRYLADLESCAVLHPQVGEHFPELSQLIASLDIYQHVPQIEVAIGDHDVALVVRHMEPLTLSDQSKLKEFAEQYGFQIYLQPNPPAAIQKLWPQDENHRLAYTLPEHKR